VQPYYLSILGIGVANLVLAAVAYAQRAKQIRGNALRERQIELAEARNALAERRLRCLDDQLAILGEIRDSVCADREQPAVGVIDIGSASVRLVVARLDAAQSSFVRLCKSGAYMQLGPEVERHGRYTQATLKRLDDRLRALVTASEQAGCERLAVVITAPGRVGCNVSDLLRVVGQATGREPLLLSPEQEACLAFAGATIGSAAADVAGVVVCDVGGGSTEIAVGSRHAGISASASFPIGAFVLAERHFRHDPPTSGEIAAARRDIHRTLALDLEAAPGIALVTGGSARAVAKLAGPYVGAEELATTLAAVTRSKKAVKNPRRRHSLPAGILILDALQSAIQAPLILSPAGLREGVLLQLSQDRHPQPPDASSLILPARALRAA